MVAKQLPFAFALSLAAAWAKDGYLGLAGRGLLVGRDSGCTTGGPQSCHNTTAQPDLCCFEAPGVSSAFLSFRRKTFGIFLITEQRFLGSGYADSGEQLPS